MQCGASQPLTWTVSSSFKCKAWPPRLGSKVTARVTGCVAINYRGWRVAAEQKGIFNYLSVNDIILKKKKVFAIKKKHKS